MRGNSSNTAMAETNPLGFAGPLRRALEAHGAGRLGEAEFYCRLVLAAEKKQFDALHLLGMIEFQRGRFDEAYQLFRRALKINPRSVQANTNLALVLAQLDRYSQALVSLDKALAIEPDNLLTLNNRGHVLWRLKRQEEALESLDRALAINPNYADALCNRGNALVDLKRFEEALASYDKALVINPNDAPALNNRANVLWALDRRDEALQSYDQALAIEPNDLSTLKDRGAALTLLHRAEEALACFERALALKPGDLYFIFKRGSALAELNRYEEALACFDRVFESDNADALNDRGNVLAVLQRHADAIASFDRALAIAPEDAKVHWNRGFALLRTGDFEQGWKEYEWRGKLEEPWTRQREFAQPRWRGEEPVEGKTILIHAEQGFGDTIQFVRYVPLVAALGTKVVLDVQPALKTLLAGIDGAAVVTATGGELPPFDLHCPLMSLPLAFKTRLETIPAAVPYLAASPERLATWNERLPKSQALRVGIGWAGNPNFPHDDERSIGLSPLVPLLSIPGVQFLSLQKDLRDGDEEILRRHPHIIHLGDKLDDFDDTAAVMSLVDLVISSDTAPVHLAGALGRPVWILLKHTADWRWLIDREDNPWYSTARLFRQSKVGDWESVVGQVAAALETSQFRRLG